MQKNMQRIDQFQFKDTILNMVLKSKKLMLFIAQS